MALPSASLNSNQKDIIMPKSYVLGMSFSDWSNQLNDPLFDKGKWPTIKPFSNITEEYSTVDVVDMAQCILECESNREFGSGNKFTCMHVHDSMDIVQADVVIIATDRPITIKRLVAGVVIAIVKEKITVDEWYAHFTSALVGGQFNIDVMNSRVILIDDAWLRTTDFEGAEIQCRERSLLSKDFEGLVQSLSQITGYHAYSDRLTYGSGGKTSVVTDEKEFIKVEGDDCCETPDIPEGVNLEQLKSLTPEQLKDVIDLINTAANTKQEAAKIEESTVAVSSTVMKKTSTTENAETVGTHAISLSEQINDLSTPTMKRLIHEAGMQPQNTRSENCIMLSTAAQFNTEIRRRIEKALANE